MKFDYEVLIIGGGPAGLSAAMSLGRIGRTALVADDNRPRNAASSHLNNFPSQDGIHPEEWRKKARKDLEKYPSIKLLQDRVESVQKTDNGFQAWFSSCARLNFKKVILAYGVQDKLPDIPGLKDLWGKAVYHCPFCHGFEVRGHSLGYVANGAMAAHGLPMISALSSDLILFTHGPAEIPEDLRKILHQKNIPIVEDKIERLIVNEDKLTAVALSNGQRIERSGLFVAPILPFEGKSSLGKSLGCEVTEMGSYKMTEKGATTVRGVFAAGDIMTYQHSVLFACAHGAMAAAGAIFELVNEDFKS